MPWYRSVKVRRVEKLLQISIEAKVDGFRWILASSAKSIRFDEL
jgi:hypothetical protein